MDKADRWLGGALAGMGIAGGALEMLLGEQRELNVYRLLEDPWDQVATIRRILDTRHRPSLRYRAKGRASSVPTKKRAKVKAARKANVARMNRLAA